MSGSAGLHFIGDCVLGAVQCGVRSVVCQPIYTGLEACGWLHQLSSRLHIRHTSHMQHGSRYVYLSTYRFHPVILCHVGTWLWFQDL